MFKRYSLVAGSLIGSYFIKLQVSNEPISQTKFKSSFKNISKNENYIPRKNYFNVAYCNAVKGTDETQEAFEHSMSSNNRPGFKDRKIIEYENRIRAFSTPDKIFRYFATYKFVYENGESEVFMTPEDFLRSITPGQKQPEKFGLDKFKTKKVANSSEIGCSTLKVPRNNQTVFESLGECGLISFSDYVFMLTVLATPQRNFEIAFRMFDLNGDGCVDVDEFYQVTTTARSQTTVGMRHRDHKNTGNVVKSFRNSNSALVSYFFGPTGHERKLTVDRFIQFQKQLQEDVLKLEFTKYQKNKDDPLIKEDKFVKMLLTYSGLSPKKQKQMLKRVKREFEGESSRGVSFEETKAFFVFIKQINDVDLAFDFYRVVGADIDKETMKRVAKTVAAQEISDHVIDIVYTAFDEDGNGSLSDKEFISIMKRRLMRGLEKPKDTGFFRLLDATWRCAKETSWR